jgi:hypothetical protein
MSLSNYPPGVSGNEPAISGYDESDGVQDLECECGFSGEIPTFEVYEHGVVYWTADWTCPDCSESYSSGGEYDPADYDNWERD